MRLDKSTEASKCVATTFPKSFQDLGNFKSIFCVIRERQPSMRESVSHIKTCIMSPISINVQSVALQVDVSNLLKLGKRFRNSDPISFDVRCRSPEGI